MCNDVATTPIRISPLPPLTIVVRVTTATTWDRVSPQSSIANILSSPCKSSAMVRIHQHLILFTNAVTNCTITRASANLGETPLGCFVDWRRWFNHHGKCKKEEYNPRLKLHFFFSKWYESFFIFFFGGEGGWAKREKRDYWWWYAWSLSIYLLPFLLEKGGREGYRWKARKVCEVLGIKEEGERVVGKLLEGGFVCGCVFVWCNAIFGCPFLAPCFSVFWFGFGSLI